MEEFMAANDIGASALGVMRDGSIVYNKSFGWKNRNRTKPLPADVMMRVASLTKPITAAAIRDLVARGGLSLDDKAFDVGQPGGGVLDLEPWPKIGDSRMADITIGHLIRHRGGWDANRAGGDPTFMAIKNGGGDGVKSPPSREQMVRYIL